MSTESKTILADGTEYVVLIPSEIRVTADDSGMVDITAKGNGKTVNLMIHGEDFRRLFRDMAETEIKCYEHNGCTTFATVKTEAEVAAS